MAKEWYLSKGEKRVGPLSVKQLERRAERGKLPRGAKLWREGMESPLPVAEVDLGVALAEPPKKKGRPKRSAISGRRKSPLAEDAPRKRKKKKRASSEEPPLLDLDEIAVPEEPLLDLDEIAVPEEPVVVPSLDELAPPRELPDLEALANSVSVSDAPECSDYVGRIELDPISEEISELSSASIWIKLKNVLVTTFAFAFLGGLLYLAAMLFQLGWLETTAYVVGGLGAVLGVVLSLMTKVADCPSCGGLVGTKTEENLSKLDDGEILECRHCYELLLSHEGEVKALAHGDAPQKQRKGLEAPVFEDGCWADECVVCGDAVDHVEEASKTKVELAQLLVGTLSVASTSIKDIPYCAQHSGQVSITIRDDHARLVFQELDARRRYVHINRDCKPAKV
jgi:uncharacterized protein DUF4339